MSKLGVLFTKNVSLKIWVDTGLFEREKLIYEKQLLNGDYDEIYWFTYGRSDDIIGEKLKEKKQLDLRIKIIPMPKLFYTGFGGWLYSCLLPMVRAEHLRKLDIIKTNQLDGGWTAALIKYREGIPFLLRTGYTYTKLNKEYLKLESGLKWIKRKIDTMIYEVIEKKLYNNSDRIIVSSQDDKNYIYTEYSQSLDKIAIIPNFIDTSQFYYNVNIMRQNRCVFVGRLNAIKNVENLILAVAKCNLGLDIYGEGELKRTLEDFALKNKYDVKFKGRISNNLLNGVLNQYQYFALTSLTEGMPKALLEAMACGVICIGTNVSGILEVLEDNRNGFLSTGIGAEEIAVAIQRAQAAENKEMLRKAGIETIKQKYSLESIVKLETRFEKDLINR